MKQLNYIDIVKCLSIKSCRGVDVLIFIKNNPNCCVQDIYKNLNFDQVTASTILAYFKNNGVVTSNIDGQKRRYNITDESIVKLIDILEKFKDNDSNEVDQ